MDALMSSSEPQQATLPLWDSNDREASNAGKGPGKKKSQKRRSVYSRYNAGGSRKKRTSKFKKTKEASLQNVDRGISRDHGLEEDSSNAFHAEDILKDPKTDDLNNRGSCRRGSPEWPSTLDAVDIRNAAQLDNAEALDSPSFQTLKDLGSGYQTASGSKQDASEARVLRPRRPSSREAVTKGVAVCQRTQMIGRRIHVYWPDDDAFYGGLIISFDKKQNKHHIIYDDGQEELLDLAKEKYRLSPDQGDRKGMRGTKPGRMKKNVKDSSIIGDDVLLSAVVSKHRLEGGLRKGPCNGSVDMVTSPHWNDVAELRKDIFHAGNESKILLKRKANELSAQEVPDGMPNVSCCIEDTADKEQAKEALSAVEESWQKSGRGCDLDKGHVAHVYVRRRNKAQRVPSLVSEAGRDEISRKDKKLIVVPVDLAQIVGSYQQDQVSTKASCRSIQPPKSLEGQPDTVLQPLHKFPKKKNKQSLKTVVQRSLVVQGAQSDCLVTEVRNDCWDVNTLDGQVDQHSISKGMMASSRGITVFAEGDGDGSITGEQIHEELCTSPGETLFARTAKEDNTLAHHVNRVEGNDSETRLVSTSLIRSVGLAATGSDTDVSLLKHSCKTSSNMEAQGVQSPNQFPSTPIDTHIFQWEPHEVSVAEPVLKACEVVDESASQVGLRLDSLDSFDSGNFAGLKKSTSPLRVSVQRQHILRASPSQDDCHLMTATDSHTSFQQDSWASLNVQLKDSIPMTERTGVVVHMRSAEVLTERTPSSVHPMPAFHCAVHLVRLHPAPSLFTWHLFNILKSVAFFEGNSFEKGLHFNGSVQDLAGWLCLVFAVVRALPLNAWVDERGWQGRLLFDAWKILSGSQQWHGMAARVLPAKAESLLMQLLKQLTSEPNCVSFRQFLNVIVCYFIKPYIAATLCERGALLTVLVQRFLLLQRSKSPRLEGILCKHQAMEVFKMRLDANSFTSYLNHFHASKDRYTEMGLFGKQKRSWRASVTALGHAKEFVLIPSVNLLNGLGLQVTTACLVNKEWHCATWKKNFYLRQNCGYLDALMRSICNFSRNCAVNGVLTGVPDFFSGLIAISLLQKNLLVGCKEAVSTGEESVVVGFETNSLSLLEAQEIDHICDEHGKQIVELSDKELGSDVLLSRVNCVVQDGAATKRAKVEADEFTHCRASSAMQFKGDFFFKEECFVDSFDLQRDVNGAPLGIVSKDTYPAVGSPSASSLESNIQWTSAGQLAHEYGQDLKRNREVFGEQNGEGAWIDPRVANYYGGPPVERKRKRKNNRLVYRDGSRLHSWRDPGKVSNQFRPLASEPERVAADEVMPSHCCANLLLTRGDVGWREEDAKIELFLDGGDCLLGARSSSGKFYTHKVQDSSLTSNTNRYTHAMMWKGGKGWCLEFCDRGQWIIFKRLYEKCSDINARAASVKQIPIPGVKRIDEELDFYGSPGLLTHWPPASFIRHKEGEVEYAFNNSRVLYDMESDDDVFVNEYNRNEQGAFPNALTEEVFERILFELEKVTYQRQGKMVLGEEAVELCRGLGPQGVLQAVHIYWWKKRLSKGTALVRHFQPPLWEQYQKQVERWKTKLGELQFSHSHRNKEQLEALCPRPLLFAFCLPSRGLDINNSSRKIQKQRSQKKLSVVLKSSRTSSLETSEESHIMSGTRSHRMHVHSSVDPDWHPSPRVRPVVALKYRHSARGNLHERAYSGYALGAADSNVEEAQAKAAEARRVATIKAARWYSHFVKFDSSYQRAMVALIEFEAIKSTELVNTGQDDEACSSSAPSEQFSFLKDRVELLSSQYSGLLDRGSDLDRDRVRATGGAGRGSAAMMWEIGKPEFQESTLDSDALLPMSASGHADSWMGTTLIQRVD